MSDRLVSRRETCRRGGASGGKRGVDFSAVGLVPAGAGPAPVGGSLTEAATHGIGVQVVDGRENRPPCREIAIVARQRNVVTPGRWRIVSCSSSGLMTGNELLLDAVGVGALDGEQQFVDSRRALDRMHEKMDMFGHEDERRQLPAAAVDGAGQLLSPRVVGQQRQASVAGKRQLVAVTWKVEVLNSLAVRI